MRGSVEAIHIAPAAGAEMTPLLRAQAVPGRGLVGDRYFREIGTWSRFPDQSGKDLTLIEAEVLEHLGLEAAAVRRNLATRGIRLNELVGRRFRIGEIACAGVRLCEPCTYLQGHAAVTVQELAHRGGLRADILTSGGITVGDVIEIEPESRSIGRPPPRSNRPTRPTPWRPGAYVC